LTDGSALWLIGSDFSVTPIPADRIMGIGSGGDYATGAAAALLELLPAEEALRKAVLHASAFDTGTGGTPQVEVARRPSGENWSELTEGQKEGAIRTAVRDLKEARTSGATPGAWQPIEPAVAEGEHFARGVAWP
jgi:hypothetical protein